MLAERMKKNILQGVPCCFADVAVTGMTSIKERK
jgi:hypothetical protein